VRHLELISLRRTIQRPRSTNLKIFILFLALTQASVSLDETLTWLVNFSKEHGCKRDVHSLPNKKLHINSLRVVEGCSVVVEHEYFEPSVRIRRRTAPSSLGDFDPAKIEATLNLTDEADNPVFSIELERSDSAPKIQAALEMRDGSKKTVLSVSEFFYMDSREAAQRFQKALAHAITLCGGKPAPF
jgi:hypothetical protein